MSCSPLLLQVDPRRGARAEERGEEREAGRRYVRPANNHWRKTCYFCGQEGHIKRNCPLNFNGLAGKVNGGRPGAADRRMFTNPYTGCNMSGKVNSLLFSNGNVGDMPMRMLLDSGAAISVVRMDTLSDNCRKQMTMTAVGANGCPLKVMGQVAMKIYFKQLKHW